MPEIDKVGDLPREVRTALGNAARKLRQGYETLGHAIGIQYEKNPGLMGNIRDIIHQYAKTDNIAVISGNTGLGEEYILDVLRAIGIHKRELQRHGIIDE